MTGHVVAANDPAYDGLFTGIKRSWFRLETLQHYSAGEDDDVVRAVAAGQQLPRQEGPWYEMLRAHTTAGRVLRRVHVIEEPHSPYISYELAIYQSTTAAGEDVRIVPTLAGTWPADMPRRDFWILDEGQVWAMRYDDDGALEAAERVTDPVAIAQYLRWADVAWQAAVPLAAYKTGAALRQVT